MKRLGMLLSQLLVTNATCCGLSLQTGDLLLRLIGLKTVGPRAVGILPYKKLCGGNTRHRTRARKGSLRSDRTRDPLDRYVATELEPKLGRYVATELEPKLGRYVATKPKLGHYAATESPFRSIAT
ncbi:hypothetical protein F2Q70_00003099 [Brassica cretica]|uniref:Uncharacterized protein n=1 Tax=Brassica cretica TaxID=69181 RepID=A0A8S9IU66_BRACR|nr:hypothetical protein F2Q70_00003099 [Brassica cretica]